MTKNEQIQTFEFKQLKRFNWGTICTLVQMKGQGDYY